MATVSIRLGVSLQEEVGAVLVGAAIDLIFFLWKLIKRRVGLRAQ